MPANVESLVARIDDLLRRDAEFRERPRLERFSRVNFNPYREGSPEWQQYEAKSKAEDDYLKDRANLDGEFQELLDATCIVYLDSNAVTRGQIRQISAERPWFVGHVWEFARWAAEQIVWPEDVRWLRIGLAAMAIEDCRFDYRDETVALGMLYYSAQSAGIDPEPLFQEIAAISGEEMASKMRAGKSCATAMGHATASHLSVLQKRKRERR